MNRKREAFFRTMSVLIAVAVALVITIIIIFCVSDEPLEALKAFLTGPLSTKRRIGNVVESMIPLIFTGLAACIMFQAKQFSLIGDGAFLIGGLVTAMLVLSLDLPIVAAPILGILVGGIAGAICAIIPGYLKAKWNTNEFVVSMMFNSILEYFALYVLLNVIRDPDSGFLASFELPDNAKLFSVVSKTNIHAGLFVALAMVVLAWFFMYKTKWGYSIRMVGINPSFARYSGINTFMIMFACQIIGGFVAGIGGSVELLGMYDRYQWQSSPGYGFDGMTVAILAANNPALVPVGALFLAYIRVGTDVMARTSNIPNEAVNIIQGIIMLLITASAFLEKTRHRMVVSSVKEEQTNRKEA